jgi:hypothetical protein
MKFLFSIISFFTVLQVSAQRFEIGANGGLSNTAIANESLYEGDKGKWSYATGLNFHLNINDHLQGGIEMGMTRWERSTDWPLYATNNQYLGTKKVDFVFAERAVSLALRFNYMIPFYEQWEDFVRSSLYVGVTAGAVATGNDGSIEYSRTNPSTPAEYSYVSRYQYESGYGTLLGAQIGYTYFFSKVIGLNIEFAPKISWIKTIDSKYGYANDTYNILYFPTTLGIRFRFGEVY